MYPSAGRVGAALCLGLRNVMEGNREGSICSCLGRTQSKGDPGEGAGVLWQQLE